MGDRRPVSVIDYNEFRKLEDKRDRIQLKKVLYERKKVNDEKQVGLLNQELDEQYQEKEKLRKKLQLLSDRLNGIRKNIVDIERTGKRQLK